MSGYLKPAFDPYKQEIVGCERSEKCMRCKFMYNGYCNYSENHRPSRLFICQPGDACTVFEPKKQEPKKLHHPVNFKKEKEISEAGFFYRAVRELYDDGKNDREIAEEMRCSRTKIRRWRCKESLPPVIGDVNKGGVNHGND